MYGLTLKFAFVGVIFAAVQLSAAQSASDALKGKNAIGFSGRFNPADGSVIAASDDSNGWFVWTFASVVPETVRHEVVTTVVRYFVQPLDGSKRPRQLYEEREQGRGGAGTMMPDGSVLLSTMSGIVWAKAGGQAHVQPLPKIGKYDLYPVALYPDGIVGQEYRPEERGARTWWVPIDAHSFKMESCVQLDEDLESARGFIRHGDKIAWLNAPLINENTPKSMRRKPVFCLFDATSGRLEKIPVKVEGGATLLAFNGKTGIGGGMMIDATTGKVTPLQIPGDVIGIAGNAIYAIKTAKPLNIGQRPDAADVLAVAIDQPGQPRVAAHIDLAKMSRNNPTTWVNPRDCVLLIGDKLRIWDGERWVVVAEQ